MPEPQSSVSEGAEIFIPSKEDRDPVAEEKMQQGREDLSEDNALYDPYFSDAEHAQDWAPGQAG